MVPMEKYVKIIQMIFQIIRILTQNQWDPRYQAYSGDVFSLSIIIYWSITSCALVTLLSMPKTLILQ